MALTPEQLNILRQALEAQEKGLELTTEQTRALELYENALKSSTGYLERRLAILEEQLKLEDDILKKQELKYKKEMALLEIAKEKAKGDAAEIAKIEKKMELLGQVPGMAAQFDAVLDSLTGISSKWEKTALGQLMQPNGMRALGDSLQRTITPANILGSTLMKVQEATLNLAYAQDSALAEFNKNTGAARLYGDQLIQLESDMYRFGVSMDDAAQVGGSLVNNMKGFNNLSGTQQKNLMETTAILNELGVNSDLTAGNMETMTRVMGLNTEQAAAQSREMFTLAQSLGMPPAEMAEAFQSASPQMAKFGSQGTEVFKKLAVNAREAGMEVDQILGIVEKFDTFEGAAESVGKLNAMLGGPFLNSLEMVRATDPTERMKKLSDALNQSGQSFDDMGYYQRIALTEAMGLKDVSELALVMAGEFDNMAGSASKSQSELIDLAKQQQEFNTVQEEFIQLMRMFAISMRPVIAGLKSFMQFLQDLNAGMGGYLPHLVVFVGLFTKFGGPVMKLVAKGGDLLKKMFSSLTSGIEDTTEALEEAQEKMEGKETSFIKLGFAALLVGGAAFLAAKGVAAIAMSFNNLSIPQIIGAVAAITLFGYGLITLLGTLGAMQAGPQAAVVYGAVAIILAIAAAAYILAAAVNLAAVGMSVFFGSIVHLFASVSVAQLFGLGASMMLLSYGMYALAASVYALPLLVAAMFGLGYALGQIDTTSLTPLAALFISIDSILSKNIENLNATKEAIAEIVESINSIDSMEKTIAVQKIIEAVQGAAGSNRVATAGAVSGGTASSGGTFVPNGTPFTVNVDLAGRTIDTYMLKFLNGKLGGL